MDSFVQGTFQVLVVEWIAISFSPGDLPDPGFTPKFAVLTAGFFTVEPPGKP